MHIEHLAIWVRDLERTRLFYETYFGAAANDKYVNSHKGFSSNFLSFPDGGPRLELMQMTGVADSRSNGVDQFIGLTHLAFSVGSESAVDSLTERFRADGFTIVGEPRRTGDGYYESVVLDPEGNQLEVTA
ncbi:VOC family protein [Spirosoma spitsbergense]|uniref:VOC family protein n=1 Tax=Spirosoma spitsbergense TaxID=431554 RepID=UPI00036FF72F|nr:VOC family protein [Spirosoma spitsbergense]